MKKLFSLFLSLALMLSMFPSATATGFADVSEGDWYYDAVNFAVANGIMSGYSADKFGPNDTLTRAMVVQVLYNKEGKPDLAGATHSFSDVPASQWFNNAVTWASNKGVVSGYGGGVFKPEDAVTIEQIAVILRNYSGAPSGNGDLSKVGKYSDWAADGLRWAVEANIIDNVPFSNATEKATRAQTAQMLTNYLSQGTASIALDITSHKMEEGQTKTLNATVTADDDTDTTVTWTSSNSKVATVDQNGTVTSISGGEATITATIASGKSAICKIEVLHNYKLSASNAPSCTSAGSEIYTCSGCNHSYTKDVPALGNGHQWVSATCSSPKKCSVCGATEGSAISHDLDNSGTCTMCGMSTRLPLLYHEYGPMKVTSYYSSGKYWWCNQISSLVFTKIEPSSSNYKVTLNMKGRTDDRADVVVYFYDKNDFVLDEVWFSGEAPKNQDYNIRIDRYIDKEVLDNAVRMQFFSYSGHPVK